jgi:hypothetical protein
MKFLSLNRIILPVALLALGALCPNLHADWGSLRGNNRSPGAPIQSAPQPAQQPIIRQQQQQPAFRPSQSPPAFHPAPQPEFHPQPQQQPAFHPQQSPPASHPQPQMPQSQPEIHPQPQSVHPEQQRPATPQPHEQTRPSQHFQSAPAQVDRAHAAERDRRRMDVGDERRQSYFWSDYHRGMHINRLPDGYRRFRFHDRVFFYFQGVYYDNEPSGYVVVDAPVDADVPDLPPGAETLDVNGTLYYYADGVFYIQQADGSYVVVAAPIGATVSMLPPDAVAVAINGSVFYQSGGTYYMPVMQNGVTAYLVVPQPQS